MIKTYQAARRWLWPLLLLVGLYPAAVWAQVVTAAPDAATTIISLKPLMDNFVIPLASAAIPILASWIAIRVSKWLGLKSKDEVRKYVEPALQNALAFGQQEVNKLPLTVDAKNQIVASAANYAAAHVNDGLKLLGLDRDALINLLKSRLESNINAQTPQITATTGPTPQSAAAPVIVPAATVSTPAATLTTVGVDTPTGGDVPAATAAVITTQPLPPAAP